MSTPTRRNPHLLRMATACYLALLWLYPPRFRRRFGRQMGEAFEDRSRAALRRGEGRTLPALATLSYLLSQAIVEVALNSFLEWLSLGRGQHAGRLQGERNHPAGPPLQGPRRTPPRWGRQVWIRNLRYGLRTLKKSPSFALTTVALIGLGVGSVTTIFTLVDHVLLRPLPYPSAERLFLAENGPHSGPMVREFLQMRSVDQWAIASTNTTNLTGEGDPLRVNRTEVSRDFFSLFGARPEVGRLLVEGDYTATDVAVLSHGIWVSAFGSDPAVVGSAIRLDDALVTVVGVLSKEFLPPEGIFHGDAPSEVWLPLDLSRGVFGGIGRRDLEAVGRVAPGATLARAEAEMVHVRERLAHNYPETLQDRPGHERVYATPPVGLQEVTTRPVRVGLGLLLGAVGILLLVACMNVAHLFLAHGLGRVQEMAVRRALGADTTALVQQLLVESVVLGTAGGILGVGLATLGLQAFLALSPSPIPRSGDVSLDLRVLLFSAAVTSGTVLLFGLVPALRSVGEELTNDLKGASRAITSGRGASRMRSGLVVAEVAFSLILVAGAGLLLKSFVRLQARDPGFRSEGVWTIPLSPTSITSTSEYLETMDRVEASLAGIPGVSSTTYSLTLPFEITGPQPCCWIPSLGVDGQWHDGLQFTSHPTTESYFSTFGIPLVAGRVWSSSEGREGPSPAVITEAFAIKIFGSAEGALDRLIELAIPGVQFRVAGVAADVRHFGLDQSPPSFIYTPMERLRNTMPVAHMAVRILGDPPADWARTLREAVWDAAPNMPVPIVRSMDDWVDISTAGRRFDSVLFGAFGVMALILAACGLYGTLLYTVGQQRRELGIRMALGAGRGGLEREVIGKGLALTAVGSVLGLGGFWASGHLLESRLYNLEPTDTTTLLGAVVVLLSVAALASWYPARQAGRADPLATLKAE